MQRCAFTPYEGKKPYIFVSYAHKDSARVYPVLEELDRRGYRVWYDDGIVPGSEWPENIAQHLNDCALTLAFVSPNSIASDNCRREVTFALSKRKPFLGIILEPTAMSPGMELQLSAQQCIMKYTYQSDEAFYKKVTSCPDLTPCLGQPKVVPVAEKTVAAPAEPVVSAPVPQPVKESKPVNKKMMGIIAAAAAAVVLLGVVLGIVLGGNPSGTGGSSSTQPTNADPQNTDPSQTDPAGKNDEIYLHYADQTITAEDIAYISQQTQLDKLELHSCAIQDGAMDSLTLANTVTEVIMTNCTGVSNLSCLKDLRNLVTLNLEGCDVTDDAVVGLRSEALFEVNISGNGAFSDLSAFSSCAGIRHINFSGTAVSSVKVLEGMKDLISVNGSDTKVTDIASLASLTNLTSLEFANCGMESIDGVFNALRLEKIDLSGNMLFDLEAFQYCTVLREVYLAGNDLSDIDILEKNTATLEILDVSCNGSIYEWDLEFIGGCGSLRELYIDGLNLGTLAFLRNNVGLEKLSACNCRLNDISDMQKLTNLSYLCLAFNDIVDITPLSGLTAGNIVLDLSFNDSLSDLSALPTAPHYQVLNLTNGYLDLDTLPQIQGTTLLLFFVDEVLEKDFTFEEYGIIGCPMDRVVAAEDRFGAEYVVFVEELTDYCTLLELCGLPWEYLQYSM